MCWTCLKLRVEDEKEIEALTGLDTLAALTLGYFHSDSCMAAVGRSGNVCGLFGVVPVAEAVGGACERLLTSHEIVPNIREVLGRQGTRGWMSRTPSTLC